MSNDKKLVTRRDFLVAGGAVIAAGALSACSSNTVTETVTSQIPTTVTKTVTSTAVAPAGATTTVTSTVTGTGTGATGGLITVMNPLVPNTYVERIPLTAPRLDKIDGKKIMMVDIGWGGPEGSYVMFGVMKEWFAKNYPTAKVEVVFKKGSYGADDPDLWKRIGAEFDAAIVGMAG